MEALLDNTCYLNGRSFLRLQIVNERKKIVKKINTITFVDDIQMVDNFIIPPFFLRSHYSLEFLHLFPLFFFWLNCLFFIFIFVSRHYFYLVL